MYDPLQFRWRSPSLSRASVSSIRSSYFFVSAYPRRILLCSVQSGRWLLRMRDQSDKATTRRSACQMMDGAGRIGNLPSLGVARLSRQCFLSRLPGSRVPPSLLTAARGGFPPSWFYGWRQRVLSLGPDRQDGRVQASPTWTRWYGKAKKKALVLLCPRLAAANTSTSRSVALFYF